VTRTGYFVRLAISVAIDLFDFTIGRAPLMGTVGEGMSTFVLVLLWGWPGLAYAGEFLDFTEQIDGFVPTATIIAIGVGMKNGHLTGPKSGGPPAR
jgi:hypothetical protein